MCIGTHTNILRSIRYIYLPLYDYKHTTRTYRSIHQIPTYLEYLSKLLYMSMYLQVSSPVPGVPHAIPLRIYPLLMLFVFWREGTREELADAAVRGGIARPRPWPSNPRMRPASQLPPARRGPLQLCHYVPRRVAALVVKQLKLQIFMIKLADQCE